MELCTIRISKSRPHALIEMLLQRRRVKATINRAQHWAHLGPHREILLAQSGKLVARQVAQREAGGSVERTQSPHQDYALPSLPRYSRIAGTEVSRGKSSTSRNRSKVCSKLIIKFTCANESQAAKSLSDVSLVIFSGVTLRVVAITFRVFSNKSINHSLMSDMGPR